MTISSLTAGKPARSEVRRMRELLLDHGFQHLLLSILIAVGCFYLVLSHPDIKEVWVIIGAVIQYWFSRANGNGNGATNGVK